MVDTCHTHTYHNGLFKSFQSLWGRSCFYRLPLVVGSAWLPAGRIGLVCLSGKHYESDFFLNLDLFNQYKHMCICGSPLAPRQTPPRRSLPTPLLHLQSSFAYLRLSDSETNRFLFVLLGVGRILLLNHLDYQVHFPPSPPATGMRVI